MRQIDAAGVDRALTFPGLIDALDAAFRGGVVTPVRHHHHIRRPDADATLLLMPAWTDSAQAVPGPAYLGTKIVTVFPANAARGLPSVAGLYLLMDGATGAPLAAIDGARLTLWRTAAASALAARAMARPDARRLLMVGAGALSGFLPRAHAAVRPLTDIAVWNRSPDGAQRAVAALAAHGLPARVSQDLEADARAADIISCATLSTAPLIMGAWLKPGAHLDLVGAFNLAMREADDAALLRGHVVIDTAAALTEGGDVALAVRDGGYAAERVAGTLHDLVSGRIEGRPDASAVTVFKSVGTALEDLAAAILVHQSG
jgi:ornithine cyclodeaminase/alanine dehydrogenase-like protein (mu-crystallin family)